jgi:two-component system phosphate regulon response regulator PhoB
MRDRQDDAAKLSPTVGACSRFCGLSSPLRALLQGERLQVEIAAIDAKAFDTLLSEERLNLSIKAKLSEWDEDDACDRERLPLNERHLRLRFFVHAQTSPPQAGGSAGQEDKASPRNGDVRPGIVWPAADRGLSQETGIIALDDLVIDLGGRRVWRGCRAILLTKIEFELLLVLSRTPGRVLSRRQLIAGAWPERIHVEPRTVTVHVGHLRKRLMGDGASDLIRTVRGAGYALELSAIQPATDDTRKDETRSQP